MSVTAKFHCQNITPTIEENPGAHSRVVTFGAVCRGAANRDWASATPAGSITMTIRNDHATAQFVKGEEYLLTFEHAPKPVPADGHKAQPGPTSWQKDEGAACEVCGIPGTYHNENGQWWYEWDEAAQKRHDEAYGGNV